MKVNAGDEIEFESVEEIFDVRAANERFAVCVSGTYHTIIDWEREVRGPNNLIFQPYQYSDQEDCNMCLIHLMSGECEVSRRNEVSLDILTINGKPQ